MVLFGEFCDDCNKENCTKCSGGFYEGKCIDECPSGYFTNSSDNTCFCKQNLIRNIII